MHSPKLNLIPNVALVEDPLDSSRVLLFALAPSTGNSDKQSNILKCTSIITSYGYAVCLSLCQTVLIKVCVEFGTSLHSHCLCWWMCSSVWCGPTGHCRAPRPTSKKVNPLLSLKCQIPGLNHDGIAKWQNGLIHRQGVESGSEEMDGSLK